MVIIRNRLSATRSGGPRAWAELRDRYLIRASSPEDAANVTSELSRIDIVTKDINNAPILVAEPRTTPANVFDRIREIGDDNPFIRQASDEVADAGEGVIDATRSVARATRQVSQFISELDGVRAQEFVNTFTDFGPENLRFSLTEMPTVSTEVGEDRSPNLDDLADKFDMEEIWEDERGSNAVVAVFDTGFARDLIDSSRVVGRFHGEEADSVFESSEGHGTMCVGAAAANSDEGVPFDGMAPDADVILVRTTDSGGQIRGDYITQAWDWLIDRDIDRPIVTNHSYGTPLCSGRPRAIYCNTAENEMVSIANSTGHITSVYAAGNEATTCGRRLSGVTNAVTGTNSLAEVITSGALRFDERDAQEYSSHGRGDCAPQSDPKPNVTFPLPSYTYYGGEDGYIIKDMSKGVGGSAGGTSHASPSLTGLIALVQSKHYKENERGLQTEELKPLLHQHAEQPRPTQVNIVSGFLRQYPYDSRFGHGVPQPKELIEAV